MSHIYFYSPRGLRLDLYQFFLFDQRTLLNGIHKCFINMTTMFITF